MTDGATNIETKEGQEELRRRGIRPVPAPDDLTRPYWEAARRHQLVLQYCRSCGDFQHPPEPSCAGCGSRELTWRPVSGKGTVYSFIVDRRLLIPGFREPYVVAQINPLEARRDTVRITANIVGCDLEAVRIGMPVEVTFVPVNERVTLPQFRPAAGD